MSMMTGLPNGGGLSDAPLPDVLAGIARYRVLSSLGEGGQGAVYLVRDEAEGGQTRALKLLRNPRGAEELDRFRREFSLLRELRHPNIVRVYDFGVSPTGVSYFTMDHVEGMDLKAAAADLSLVRRLGLLIQVGEALDFLHSRGWLHLDIKPSNLLVDSEGQVKLLDFGLTERRHGAEAGVARGTFAYMSPEMLRGEEVGPAADIYALGVVAFELLTGRLPFQAADLSELVRCHIEEPPPRARDICPALPAEVELPIERLLEKEPALRYAVIPDALYDLCFALGRPYRESDHWRSGTVQAQTLVGRRQEMERLQGLFDGCVTHCRSAVLVISGEPGVGKSRLLDELGVKVQLLGARVGRTVGSESPVATLAALARKVLDPGRTPLQSEGAAGESRSELDPFLAMGARWVSRLMSLGREPVGDGEPLTAPDTAGMEAAAAYLLSSVTRQAPVLLILERAAEPGPETIAVLRRLSKALYDQPLLIALEATRLPDKAEDIHRIDVPPLDRREIAEMLENILGQGGGVTDVAPWVAANSGGIPALVPALSRGLLSSGLLLRRQGRWFLLEEQLPPPAGGSEIVARWAEAIPGDVRDWLSVAAVLGVEFTEEAVARIAPSLPGRASTARSLGLIEPLPGDERRWRFRVNALREELLQATDPHERRLLHGAAATLYEGVDGAPLEVLAHHLLRSSRPERGYGIACRAAAELERRMAPRAALDLYLAALRLLEDGQVADVDVPVEASSLHERIGGLHAILGEGGLAIQELETALGLAGSNVSSIVQRMAQLLLSMGEGARAEDLLRRQLGAMGEATASAQAPYLVPLARCCMQRGDLDLAEGFLEQARRSVRPGEDILREVRIHNTLGMVYQARRDFDASCVAFGVCKGLLDPVRNPREAAAVRVNLGNNYKLMGDTTQALAYYREAASLARTASDAELVAAVSANIGMLDVLGMTLSERIEEIDRALYIYERLGRIPEGVSLRLILGDALRFTEELPRALSVLSEAREMALRHGLREKAAKALLYRAHVAIDRGDPEAEELLQSVLREYREIGQEDRERPGVEAARARLDLRAGRWESARGRAAGALAASRQAGDGATEARAHVLLAQTFRNDASRSLPHVAEGREALRRSGVWLEQIEARILLAEVLAFAERFDEALEELGGLCLEARRSGARRLERLAREVQQRVLDRRDARMPVEAGFGSVARLEQAVLRARSGGDRDLVWRCLHRLAQKYMRGGLTARAQDLLGEALSELKAYSRDLPESEREATIEDGQARELLVDIGGLA